MSASFSLQTCHEYLQSYHLKLINCVNSDATTNNNNSFLFCTGLFTASIFTNKRNKSKSGSHKPCLGNGKALWRVCGNVPSAERTERRSVVSSWYQTTRRWQPITNAWWVDNLRATRSDVQPHKKKDFFFQKFVVLILITEIDFIKCNNFSARSESTWQIYFLWRHLFY